MAKLTHSKTRKVVDVPEGRVEYYTSKGWTAVEEEQPATEELVFPDPEKSSHDVIDEFAGTHGVTFDGIEAKDAEKPTKAEKVAHLQKVISERESA